MKLNSVENRRRISERFIPDSILTFQIILDLDPVPVSRSGCKFINEEFQF